MTVVALDTYEAVQAMKAVGFTDDQATTMTRMLRNAQEIDLSNLATKTDIAKLEARIEAQGLATKTDLAKLEARIEAQGQATKTDLAKLETKISDQKSDILKWTVGTIGFQTVAILGTIAALLHLAGKS